MDIIIPHIFTQTANALATPWLINTAPIMAAVMLGSTLERRIDARVVGVGLIYHTAQLQGEWFGSFRPNQRKGAWFINEHDFASCSRSALSLQPVATFSGMFSLVIRVASDDIDMRTVSDFVGRSRLAGGQITSCGMPRPMTDVPDGYWIVDRSDLMVPSGTESNRLETLMRLTARNADKSYNTLIPAVLGYALISDVRKRGGARNGLPHAFVEPLVGVVQYQPTRGVSALPFWHYCWEQDDVFLIKGKNSDQK